MLRHSSLASSRQSRSSSGCLLSVLVNLAPVFLIVEGRVPCWTPPAPQAVKTLLTFSFVLYRPHHREAFDSSGDKRFSHVSSHSFPPRMPPAQQNASPGLSLCCRRIQRQYSPCPFWKVSCKCLRRDLGLVGSFLPSPKE